MVEVGRADLTRRLAGWAAILCIVAASVVLVHAPLASGEQATPDTSIPQAGSTRPAPDLEHPEKYTATINGERVVASSIQTRDEFLGSGGTRPVNGLVNRLEDVVYVFNFPQDFHGRAINTELAQTVGVNDRTCNFTRVYGNFGNAFDSMRYDSGYCDTSGISYTQVTSVYAGVLGSSAPSYGPVVFHTWDQASRVGSVFAGRNTPCMQATLGDPSVLYCFEVTDYVF